MAVTYSVEAKEAAHQSLVDLIDADSPLFGAIKFYTSGDTLLANIALQDPCGVVSGVTGQLTISGTPLEDASADASGDVDYVTFTDNTGNEIFRLDAQQGTSPVSGFVVMNTLTLVLGGPVSVVSATVG